MCTNEKLRCPFVYSTGKRCDGHIVRVKAYGPKRDGKTDIRKLRVWCAPKWDHAGTISSYASKDRMEFYPDQLPSDVRDDIMSLFDKGRHGISVEA